MRRRRLGTRIHVPNTRSRRQLALSARRRATLSGDRRANAGENRTCNRRTRGFSGRHYLVTRFLLEHISEGGKIINMSSGMGLRAAARQSSYTVSKAGLHIFTECLANELWPRKIDVNNLIPGPVATDIFNREGRPERYTPEEVLAKFKDELPPGFPPQERIKHPDEVGELAVHIASQPVGAATGQTFSLARRPL